MAKVCEVCGKRPMTGNRIVRRGLAKAKGGIGLHTTSVTKRRFMPNLRQVRVKDGPNSRRIKICAACLKSGDIVKA
ncbi:MAG: 50S ribosomal protein L28 [Lentisphaerae bacterium]|jgi:large subunit ribosomal protein L28|nr:50S ribosomal protein L28 [Lentisphaerota bacterium]